MSLQRSYSTFPFEKNLDGGLLPPIDASSLPPHFTVEKERYWAEQWEASQIYAYDPNSEKQIFSIDTPPPTASGKLHIGHIFSYSHTDMIARYHRMKGKNIFYPMGWDDNGLPTERRVQNYYHIWCSEHAPYQKDLKQAITPVDSRPADLKKPRTTVSRKNFVELCDSVTKEDEKQFRELFTRVGLSVDWKEEYATINAHSRTSAQYSFLDLYRKGHLYQNTSPTLWDIDFQTAIAQAEIEDRETDGAFHNITFKAVTSLSDAPLEDTPSSEYFTISTTRPELLPACIAVAAHPDDARYKHLIGKTAITPLFYAPVPIIASSEVLMDKGTGILMICTFGDVHDVQWWRSHKLPLRQVIGKNGKFIEQTFSPITNQNNNEEAADSKNTLNSNFISLDVTKANQLYSTITSCSIFEARKRIVEALQKGENGLKPGISPMVEKPRAIKHEVKYFEKGTRPLELIPTRQWFCRLLDKKEQLIEQGRKISWKPDYMIKKYDDWVNGLNYDWCISRQRFFGVPFPVWYRLDENGNIIHVEVILANENQLPVDPMFDTPQGFTESQRGQPNGFVGESDVFDTWWTSSITPQLISGWVSPHDSERHSKLYPQSMRPQSHEIIRTWAFYTISKSLLHESSIPWKEIVISGWIVDKSGAKVSKTKGNATSEPMQLLDKYLADGVRYWTGSSKLGTDTVFEESQLSVGRKLVLKIFNAGKLAFSHGPISDNTRVTNSTDLAFLAQLNQLCGDCDAWFSEYNFGKVMREAEIFFFSRFTDNYLEMVKQRIKEGSIEERGSAIITLRIAMNSLLRLFSPLLPHITEEVWSWSLAATTSSPTIHKTQYPTKNELLPFLFENMEDPNIQSILETRKHSFDLAISCIETLRKLKFDSKLKFSDEIPIVKIALAKSTSLLLEKMWGDILYAVRANQKILVIDDSLAENQFVVSIPSNTEL